MPALGLDKVIVALALPDKSRIDRRVPKKLLLENGASTGADKRNINEGVEELIWAAALKPTTIGVPAFRDGVREYMEIAVLTATLRPAAKPSRLIELIHRAVPYPIVLVTLYDGAVSLSTAHKRWSQGEAGKMVIENLRQSTPFRPDALTKQEAAFLASLTVSGLPHRDLFALYQGWLDRVVALEAAQITGSFVLPDSADRASAVRDGLDDYIRLQREITTLRGQAAKERQINRRVELNLEIKGLEAELGNAFKELGARS